MWTNPAGVSILELILLFYYIILYNKYLYEGSNILAFREILS
jgi:hypothetical protein